MATRKELKTARREGLRALGAGISDCPYARTGLDPMSDRDKALADAWVEGLICGEALSEDAKERAALASSTEQSNDLNYVSDPLGRGPKFHVGGHRGAGSHAGSFSVNPSQKPRAIIGSIAKENHDGSAGEASRGDLALQVSSLKEEVRLLRIDNQKSALGAFLELVWCLVVLIAALKVLFY